MKPTSSGKYMIRSIRADEWRAVKELRLTALRDPIAHLAFLETYEQAAAKADAFWQDRATGSDEGSTGVRQIIAEDPDGTWVGTVTVLLEEAGTTDWAGQPVERRQGHVVGVFVRPEHRGTGLTGALFEAGLEWAWRRGAERVRLLVHQANERAQGFYRKAGFVPSGVLVAAPQGGGQHELEFVIERK
jgi:GNAT superfamily N-acetyltransferase